MEWNSEGRGLPSLVFLGRDIISLLSASLGLFGSFGVSFEGWSWGCGILEVGSRVLQRQQVLSSSGPCTCGRLSPSRNGVCSGKAPLGVGGGQGWAWACSWSADPMRRGQCAARPFPCPFRTCQEILGRGYRVSLAGRVRFCCEDRPQECGWCSWGRSPHVSLPGLPAW